VLRRQRPDVNRLHCTAPGLGDLAGDWCSTIVQGVPENSIHFVFLLLCSENESLQAKTPFI
jgi:hypothetical protein